MPQGKYIVVSVDDGTAEETLAWDFVRAASASDACAIVTRMRHPIGHALDAWTPDEFVRFASGLASKLQSMKPAEIEESLRLSREYADGKLATLVA